MRKFITILFFSISLISCSQSENKINSEILNYIKKNSDDPKSYELVESNITDTITVEDCAKSKIENNKKFLLDFQNSIDEYNLKILNIKIKIEELKLMEIDEDDRKKMTQDYNTSIDRKNENINSIKEYISQGEKENLQSSKFNKDQTVMYYVYKQKYRLKNSSGNLQLFESYFIFDKNNNLINKSEDKLELYKIAEKEFDRMVKNKNIR